MGIDRESAIELAARFFSNQWVEVVRSRADVAGVRGDIAFVLDRVEYSLGDTDWGPGSQPGPGWWVMFEELRRHEDGDWGLSPIDPSGGSVRVCEVTGALFMPTCM